jgi:hypothetical protein
MPKRSIGQTPRTACCALLVLLAAIVLFSPAFEMFDKWDGFPNPDKDIVLNVLAVAVCLAATASFFLLLVRLFFVGIFAGEHPAMHFAEVTARCEEESLHPPLLCQALRI